MFAAGQNDTSLTVDTVDIYNYTSKTWTTTALSQPRSALTSTRIGNLALFAGGSGSDQVDIFNYTSNTWGTATLSQPRGYLASSSIGSLAFIAGGTDGSFSAQIDIYNITSNEWSPQINCQPGYFKANYLPVVDCLPCPEGSYSNTTNSINCYSCSPGTYSSTNGSTQCTVCPGGTYCEYGQCPTCSSCQAGSVPTANATTCVLCSPGTYATEGSPSCTPCPEGTASGVTGAISADTCQTCGAGQYSLEGTSQCLTCPNGTTSTPGSSSCSEEDSKDPISGISSAAKIAVVTIAAVFGLALIAILIILARIRFSKKRQGDLELVDIGHWTVIQNIEIGNRLGGGNFGDVFKGTWNGTTTVALKKLKSSEHLEEFAKEADVLQSLNHPNIVRFLGIYTSNTGEQFIVMEYLSKGSLDVLLALEKQSLTLSDLLAMYILKYLNLIV
ncbi:MAG: protein kinase [Nitrososphaerota archaeon]